MTLVRRTYKSYCIFGLFKWHCSYRVFLLLFFFFSLPFVLFFLLNIYNNSHIYCYTDTTNFSGYAATVFRHCALNVFALCKHCSGNSALVRHFAFFFFNSSYIPSSTVATVVTIFFFSFRLYLFFFLLYILFYYTTNFTIFLQLLMCQFLISQNKIIKYEAVTNHN